MDGTIFLLCVLVIMVAGCLVLQMIIITWIEDLEKMVRKINRIAAMRRHSRYTQGPPFGLILFETVHSRSDATDDGPRRHHETETYQQD